METNRYLVIETGVDGAHTVGAYPTLDVAKQIIANLKATFLGLHGPREWTVFHGGLRMFHEYVTSVGT